MYSPSTSTAHTPLSDLILKEDLHWLDNFDAGKLSRQGKRIRGSDEDDEFRNGGETPVWDSATRPP
jgi:hypothetical protein